MKQLFQKQFFPRLVTWHLRTLHSHSARVTPRALTEVLGTSAKLVNSTAASFIKDCPLPFTIPLFQKTNSSLLDKGDVSRAVYYSNPNLQAIFQEIPEQRIQQVIFPFRSPNLGIIIGDHASCELTIGDDVEDTTALNCKRILKIRHKKMKKHKYRKRRKRDLFKRRNLKILRERKKRAKIREEERRIEWEKSD